MAQDSDETANDWGIIRVSRILGRYVNHDDILTRFISLWVVVATSIPVVEMVGPVAQHGSPAERMHACSLCGHTGETGASVLIYFLVSYRKRAISSALLEAHASAGTKIVYYHV